MTTKTFILRSLCGLSALAMVAACDQQGGYASRGGPSINKAAVGTIAGGVAGGVLGNQIGGGSGRTVAVIAGTLLGAAIGNEVGGSLDRADAAYYNQVSQQALETAQPGQALPWTGPTGQASGVITPSNYYQTAQGQYCREYSQSITVGGQTERGYGTACRQPDGSWQIVQ